MFTVPTSPILRRTAGGDPLPWRPGRMALITRSSLFRPSLLPASWRDGGARRAMSVVGRPSVVRHRWRAAFSRFARLTRDADVVHYLFPWPFADLLHRRSVRNTRRCLLTYPAVVRQRWLGAAYAPLMWRTLRSMRVIVAELSGLRANQPDPVRSFDTRQGAGHSAGDRGKLV